MSTVLCATVNLRRLELAQARMQPPLAELLLVLTLSEHVYFISYFCCFDFQRLQDREGVASYTLHPIVLQPRWRRMGL
jgi:hypothetical protein